VPRPANAFLCFRSLYIQEQKATAQPAARQTDYSRRAAQLWNSMSAKERRPYKDIADRIQAEHSALHPDYRYIP
ncbi:high mobility group box domain-containing protein, partial [Mycena pura]